THISAANITNAPPSLHDALPIWPRSAPPTKGRIMRALYTAEALATGEGRDGHGRTSDGRVDVDLATPTDMGGSGNGTNPEQLFAVGYAACFHSALRLVAGQTKANIEDSSVGSRVSIGKEIGRAHV